MSPRIRGVVFDFDGTLVDSNAIKRAAYDEAFLDVPGATAMLERVLRERPASDRYEVIRAVVAALSPWRDQRPQMRERAALRFVRRYSRICRMRVSAAPEFPGVTATLRQVATRYRIAVNSATPSRPLRALVRARGWFRPVDPVLGAPASKVDNLARIAARWQTPPAEMVLVGDGNGDRVAAAEFGCRFVFVSYQRPSLQRAGDAVIRRFPELVGVLRRLDRRPPDRSR